MRQTMVRYTVKTDRAEENEALIKRVYEELQTTAPEGVHYATFALEDGVSFVHVAKLDDGFDDALMDVEAFRAFQSGIGERVEAPLTRSPLRQIGSYQFWGE
jgi:hypothetical protein